MSSLLLLALADIIWLGILMKDYFQNKLGHLMMDEVNMNVAALFYLTYAIGIVVFAVKPAIEKQSIKPTFIYGGLFGFLAYGTYDFTNWATLRDWPADMTLVDLSWGIIITALVGAASYKILKMIK
jgi:uncharacterized membrane protein